MKTKLSTVQQHLLSHGSENFRFICRRARWGDKEHCVSENTPRKWFKEKRNMTLIKIIENIISVFYWKVFCTQRFVNTCTRSQQAGFHIILFSFPRVSINFKFNYLINVNNSFNFNINFIIYF